MEVNTDISKEFSLNRLSNKFDTLMTTRKKQQKLLELKIARPAITDYVKETSNQYKNANILSQ